MRINLYGEEFTPEIVIVDKVASNGIRHYGLRFYLESSEKLHHTDEDDDRSAVTFWVPWTKKGGHHVETLELLLSVAAVRLARLKEATPLMERNYDAEKKASASQPF